MFAKKFLQHQGGNVAVAITIAAIPLIAGVGIAADYAKWHYQEGRLQGVADATAAMTATLPCWHLSDRSSFCRNCIFKSDVRFVYLTKQGHGVYLGRTESGIPAAS